ncbi:MAG: hypothetical protein EZS28_024860, partial [Streblomastix strix]
MTERGPIHTTKKYTPYSKKFFDIEGLTVQKIIRTSIERFPNNDHLGFRKFIPGSNKRGEYVWLKYHDTGEIVTFFGSG